jgi:hypothetical protein
MVVENYNKMGEYSDHQKRLELLHKSRVNSNNTRYLNHIEKAQKILDAHYTRQASKAFRHKALLNQKKLNWQIEYDRIRGELSRRTIPSTTREMLVKREQQLKQLGAKAINKIPE